MMVCQMDDFHLMNTVKMILREIEKAKAVTGMSVKLNSFERILFDLDEENLAETAAEAIKELTEKLYPYLAECALRGLSIEKELQATFERTGKVRMLEIGYRREAILDWNEKIVEKF